MLAHIKLTVSVEVNGHEPDTLVSSTIVDDAEKGMDWICTQLRDIADARP